MIIKDKKFDLYLEGEKIQERVLQLAAEITEDFKDKDPLFIAVLNGAFIFASDLVRQLGFNAEISFVRLSSYRQTSSTGKPAEIIGLQNNIKGRHIVILEDIVDTGITLDYLLDELSRRHAASVQAAAMFLKPDVFGDKFPVRYVGVEIPDKFVVGYGLDYEGYGRNLNDLYQLKD